MNKLYATTMTNTGGRSGTVCSPDKSLCLTIAPPGTKDATNPEELFAAGFSSCFNSALELVMQQQNVTGERTVTAIVSLYEKEKLDFVIGVELEGHIEGLSLEQTQKLLEATHQVCPYSKATRGNVEVTLKAV